MAIVVPSGVHSQHIDDFPNQGPTPCITFNSSLVPLIKGLCNSDSWEFIHIYVYIYIYIRNTVMCKTCLGGLIQRRHLTLLQSFVSIKRRALGKLWPCASRCAINPWHDLLGSETNGHAGNVSRWVRFTRLIQFDALTVICSSQEMCPRKALVMGFKMGSQSMTCSPYLRRTACRKRV